jgi:hypothetical protein
MEKAREEVHEDFRGALSPWQQLTAGQGKLAPTGHTLRFLLPGASQGTYANAQIDDYQGRPRRRFRWQPPLKLNVRARFSHSSDQLGGTAGFGFWNDPFLMTEPRMPTLPRAAWFFYASQPSNMKLDLAVPGWGWKAAVVDALRPAALPLALVALPAIVAMNIPAVYRRIWPFFQRTLKISEAPLEVEITRWHNYVLEWGTDSTRFGLIGDDGQWQVVLEAPSPQGPLGFVMWMDNQYLVATPWGKIRWGTLEIAEPQWLEVDSLSIESL